MTGPTDKDGPRPKRRRRVWNWCRCSFRWCRIALLLGVLGILLLLTWLRLVGLPDFLRVRLVGELAQRGVAADFQSLRFHWFRGLVAQDLRVRWGGTNGPRIRIEEADLDLAPPPWAGRKELIRGLAVRRGTVVVPLPLTNESPAELAITDLAADVRFLSGDQWEVRRLAASMLGFQLELRAQLTNVAGLRRPRPPADPAATAQRIRLVRNLIEEVTKWSTDQSPSLEVSIHLDGNQPWSSFGDVYLDVPQVRTPHGRLTGLRASFRAFPTSIETNTPIHTRGVIELAELQSPNGGLTGFSGTIQFQGPPRPALPTNAAWNLQIDHLFARGLRSRNLKATGTTEMVGTPAGPAPLDFLESSVLTRLSLNADTFEAGPTGTSPVVGGSVGLTFDAHHTLRLAAPESATFVLTTGPLEGQPGRLDAVKITGHLGRSGLPAPPDNGLGPWQYLWPFTADLTVELGPVLAPNLRVEQIRLDARWNPPLLEVPRLSTSLYQGAAEAEAHLNVTSRLAKVTTTTTFDLHGIDNLLVPRARENFQRYQWRQPPRFDGRAEAILPRWTDKNPDWRGEVKPTLRIDGKFIVGAGGFKGVPFDHAESTVQFDGAQWLLPDLRTQRAEGEQRIAVVYNGDTREYRVEAKGVVHPPVLKPLLGERSGEVLDLFTFDQPVEADVVIHGPWSEGTRQSILGNILATNVVFREQRFDRIDARVLYTNRTIVASSVRIRRDSGELQAEGVGYSFDEDRVWLTNVVNSISPEIVASAISPAFAPKLKPYRFDTPPTVRANGTLRPRDTKTADITFDIEGGPFHFWRLSSPYIQSRLVWQGERLSLTNIQASFYQGTLNGHAEFDLSPAADGRYSFVANARNAHLGDILRESASRGGKVAEGVFDLDLNVTNARTGDIHSWNGFGTVELRDGLLWDAPIFGFLSPVLNTIVPGLGNNRAERAEANFTLTNSVIHTRDLVIACPPAKLLYRGTLDFEQRVDAKVEAQILGDIAGVGPLFGLVLRPLTKLMEYRVTGTLAKVDAQPLYVLPKLLLLPLQPFKLLRGLFKAPESVTNAPGALVEPTPGDPLPLQTQPQPQN
ncbi:MAG: hypothetical protein JNK85_22820 [Verrucomicrobiales bacterium]|nr:hypothetical protein [Verrucomicrobiales bacterium]